MRIDGTALSEEDYITLMLILNLTQDENKLARVSDVVEQMKPLAPGHETLFVLENILAYHFLVEIQDGQRTSKRIDVNLNDWVGLNWDGLAYLINHANYYLERIEDHYDEVPEKLVTSLLRYIDLARVPAADRWVQVTDNLPEFQKLEKELEVLRDAIVRDQNANELPIPDKRAVLADLDSMLAQIKRGAVRLSDLLTNLRPTLKSVAEVCKDIAVIVGAATAALSTIGVLVSKLF